LNPNEHISTAKKVTSAMTWSFLGKTMFAFLKFLESILFIRLLGSEQFGLYGSLINFLGISTLLISFGFDSVLNKYIPLFKIDRRFQELRSLMRLAFMVRLVVFLPLATGLLLNAENIASLFFHTPSAGLYFKPILLVLALSMIYSLCRIVIDSSFYLKYISITDVVIQSLFLINASIFVYEGFGLSGVLYALVISQILLFVFFFIKFRFILSSLPKENLPHHDDSRPLLSYGLTMYWYAILTFIIGKGLDVLLLGIFLGNMTQIAYYIIAYNLAWYATGFFEMSISGSYVMSLISEHFIQKNFVHLRRIYSGLFELNYILIIPVMFGGIILRNELVATLYSRDNIGAAPFLFLFLVILGIGRHMSITQTFLAILGGEKKLLLSRFIVGTMNVLLAYLFIPRFGAMGMAFATGLSLLASVLYESILLHRLIRLPGCWSFISKTTIASTVMAVPLFLVHSFFIISSPFSLFLLIAGAIILYALLLTPFKPISAENLDFAIRGNPRLGKILQRVM
jgi:O-antigen/teichoic acid export membrane protein